METFKLKASDKPAIEQAIKDGWEQVIVGVDEYDKHLTFCAYAFVNRRPTRNGYRINLDVALSVVNQLCAKGE